MIVSLDEVKVWLRIDGTDDDVLIQTLIASAEMYVNDATGKTFGSKNKQAVLCCLLLITHWYENRGAVLVGSISKALEYSLRSILIQLEYGGETDES